MSGRIDRGWRAPDYAITTSAALHELEGATISWLIVAGVVGWSLLRLGGRPAAA